MRQPESTDAKRLAEAYFGAPARITPLGGGFYGRVFLAEAKAAQAVVKLYMKAGFHRKEKGQLEALRRVALVPMPRVYAAYDAGGETPYDAIVMEYLPGCNAGVQEGLEPESRDKIARTIVENLLAYHRCTHPEGFGELDAPSFEPDWNESYRKTAQSHFAKAKYLYDMGRIDRAVLDTLCRAMAHYDEIFCRPVPQACLIHGDYNTWNVLLNPAMTEVAAVIDPFGCRWADPELDLYQLNNANGRYYGLLERYMQLQPVSENFFMKNPFYELMTELMHYHDSGVDPREYGKLPGQAKALEMAMDRGGIGQGR